MEGDHKKDTTNYLSKTYTTRYKDDYKSDSKFVPNYENEMDNWKVDEKHFEDVKYLQVPLILIEENNA